MLANAHSRYATAIRNGGVLYQVTGDPRYARRAREILLAYAARYPDYPLHTTGNEAKVGGGRVGPQTLDEAVWLIPVAQGADLIWDTLSEDDRRAATDKLFLPAAREVILPHRMGIHNIQCWKNSAVGLDRVPSRRRFADRRGRSTTPTAATGRRWPKAFKATGSGSRARGATTGTR